MNNLKQNNNFLSQFLKTESGLPIVLKPGDLVEGVILEKNKGRLLIDLGKHGTGAVYKNELQNAKELIKELKSGDPIHAKVVFVDNEEGFVELSLSEAGKQKLWAEVAELSEKDEVIEVKLTGFNRGGLITEISGLSAFLPISQLSTENYPQTQADEKSQLSSTLEKLVGKTLKVKIIDVNSRTNKLIISERAAVEESMKEYAKNYEVGQVIEGLISGVADFGAFLKFTDNPKVEGLIHVSELAWQILDNPKEVARVDEVVKAKIIEIKDGKIFLSLKALLPDPWLDLENKYHEGEEIKGKIYSFNPFGAIVNLGNEGIQGQIHVSEFGGIEEMKNKISLDKEYPFIIESFKPEERKIILKLKK